MFKKLTTQDQIRNERGRISKTNNNQIQLAQSVSEREINEIEQGQIVSNLEIQILELQLGGLK